MRALERNKQPIYYALFEGKTPIVDEYGNSTGEYRISYGAPIPYRLNVSAAKGEYESRQFGEMEDYDKVLVTDDLSLPILETSVLWIDNLDIEQPYDYVVKKVARSLNSISIAVSKVKVSA